MQRKLIDESAVAISLSDEEDDLLNEDNSHKIPLIKKGLKKSKKNQKQQKDYHALKNDDYIANYPEDNQYCDEDGEDAYIEDEDELDELFLSKRSFLKKPTQKANAWHQERKLLNLFKKRSKRNINNKNVNCKAITERGDAVNEREDVVAIDKIKIMVPKKRQKQKASSRLRCRKTCNSLKGLLLLLISLMIVFLMLYHRRQSLEKLLRERLNSGLHTLDSLRSLAVLEGFDKLKKYPQGGKTVKKNLTPLGDHCGELDIEDVWNVTFSMLGSQSAIRMVDVNGDNELDVIIGFGTGADFGQYPQVVCQVYFGQNKDDEQGCGGGLMALDGKTNAVIWKTLTLHEILYVNCLLDIDEDKTFDCIAAGKMAGLYAISGKTGDILWRINSDQGEPIIFSYNFHLPLLVPVDVDRDGINDFVVMHGGDPMRKITDKSPVTARLLTISSRTGQVLLWSPMPDRGESYYSPQLIERKEKDRQINPYILFGTGSETSAGSLFIVSLPLYLSTGSLASAQPLYRDCCKGILVPSVLVDLNEDDTADIVLSAFNSTVLAIDGQTLRIMWRRKFGQSETFSTPAAGFFDQDNVPDFAVQYQHGSGFPNYDYTEFQILDGRFGRPLLNASLKSLLGVKSSPLTLSVLDEDTSKTSSQFANRLTTGNDLFVQWQSTCESENRGDLSKMISESKENFHFTFANTFEAERADLCALRYQSTLHTKLVAFSAVSGVLNVIYDSQDPRVKIKEFENQPNYTKLGLDFLLHNPEFILNNINSMTQTTSEDDFDSKDVDLKDRKRFNIRPQPAISPLDPFFKYKTMHENLNNPQNDNENAALLSNSLTNELGDIKTKNIAEELLNRLDKLENNKKPAYNEYEVDQMRSKRAIQIPKNVQRVVSTGSLAPSDKTASIDIVFSTHWITPTKKGKNISKDIQKCIDFYLKPELEQVRFNRNSAMFGLDRNAYMNYVINLCKTTLLKIPLMNMEEQPQNQFASKFNPFNMKMGSMTVYRKRLKCKNSNFWMKPYDKQIWPAYLGLHGNSIVNL